VASSFRCRCAYHRGALSDAEAHARAAIDAQGPHGEIATPAAVSFLIDPLIERGELAAAQQALERAGLSDTSPDELAELGTLPLYGRGMLRVAQGKTRQGLEDLLACGRRAETLGFRSPAATQWRSSAALAHAALGEHHEANQLTAEELELSRQFGAPLYLGISLRAAGLITGGTPGLKLIREAVATLENSPGTLEHARALTDLGAALRRAGERHNAREPLQQGLDLAQRCGARLLAERARTELKATGARPRRTMLSGADSLTASERRIANMAAEGQTNPQIAQALFVTKRTIETHLTHAYQKLDIQSRDQLANALAAQELTDA
jgi:DNA-binding CsgD family transcriptional regulator